MSLRSIEKRYEIQKKVVQNQITEIENLKKQISELEIDNCKKDEIIDSISVIRDDLVNTVEDLKNKREEYDKLIDELQKMKTVMNRTVFKGRWKLIKMLLK